MKVRKEKWNGKYILKEYQKYLSIYQRFVLEVHGKVKKDQEEKKKYVLSK